MKLIDLDADQGYLLDGKYKIEPIVRCKNCKYHEKTHLSTSALWTAMNVTYDYCSHWDCGVNVDGYCSDGERRTK